MGNTNLFITNFLGYLQRRELENLINLFNSKFREIQLR